MPDPWQTARLLYETSANQVKPTWEQIGEVTKSVWHDMAKLKIAGHPRWWSCNPDNATPVAAAVLRHPTQRKHGMKDLATALSAFSEAVETLAAAFSSAASEEGNPPVNGKTAKPVPAGKSAGKPTAGKTKSPPQDEGIDIDTVREKMKELVAAKGSDALLEAFAVVGAGKLADVDESQYQELIDAAQTLIDAEDDAPPAKAKTKAKGKKAGPTIEEVTEAAKALIEADKPAYVKLTKKLGKPSEMDESDYAAAIEAYTEAMPTDDDALL